MTSASLDFAPDERSSMLLYDLLSTGIIPESVIRLGIRAMLAAKLAQLREDSPAARREKTLAFKNELESYPIAIETDLANNQHYQVPTDFFRAILGPRMKYSCCLWENALDLATAEEEMLELTCQRAEIKDGQRILDLGCGWGSFSIFAAERYPGAKITAVSNSKTQRAYIEQRARELNLPNISVITADINDLTLSETFDRIVSVEMFEHAKNYRQLLAKVAAWLADDGKLFVHIFSHITSQYHFGEEKNDWLARYFFTGGTMPSHELLMLFRDDMHVVKDWQVCGQHYQKTADAWLSNMQRNKGQIEEIIASTYGRKQMRRWWHYWRIFFLACSELWGYGKGREWIVSHYLFEKGGVPSQVILDRKKED